MEKQKGNTMEIKTCDACKKRGRSGNCPESHFANDSRKADRTKAVREKGQDVPVSERLNIEILSNELNRVCETLYKIQRATLKDRIFYMLFGFGGLLSKGTSYERKGNTGKDSYN